jgi:hypothetical protein
MICIKHWDFPAIHDFRMVPPCFPHVSYQGRWPSYLLLNGVHSSLAAFCLESKFQWVGHVEKCFREQWELGQKWSNICSHQIMKHWPTGLLIIFWHSRKRCKCRAAKCTMRGGGTGQNSCQNRAEAEVAEAGFEMGVFAPWITMGPWGVGLSLLDCSSEELYQQP